MPQVHWRLLAGSDLAASSTDSTANEADFEEYRRDRAFHAWKQAMWAKGLKLPTQAADGRAVCFCGAAISSADMDMHVEVVHAT